MFFAFHLETRVAKPLMLKRLEAILSQLLAAMAGWIDGWEWSVTQQNLNVYIENVYVYIYIYLFIYVYTYIYICSVYIELIVWVVYRNGNTNMLIDYRSG